GICSAYTELQRSRCGQHAEMHHWSRHDERMTTVTRLQVENAATVKLRKGSSRVVLDRGPPGRLTSVAENHLRRRLGRARQATANCAVGVSRQGIWPIRVQYEAKLIFTGM